MSVWWLEKNVFNDEYSFDTHVKDCRKRLIHTKTEALNKDFLKRTVKFPKGVMIWGCVSANDVRRLYFTGETVNTKVYKQILEKKLII